MTQEFVTMPREVVEQALEAMQRAGEQRGSTATEFNAIEALRAAMEQPQAEQEPVAWIENVGGGVCYTVYHAAASKLPDGVRFDLYTRPQPRKPLTDEQIKLIGDCTFFHESWDWPLRFARAIEAAHNIK